MQIDRRSAKIYLWLHAGLAAALLLFPLYRALTDHMTALFSGCFLHDHLYLYCPACGGTRALAALLRLDVVSALRFNPFLVLVAVLAVAFDVWALVRLLRGKKELLPLPGWFWIVSVVLMIVYAVLRNYLMIVHGYDPTGDLVNFWHH